VVSARVAPQGAPDRLAHRWLDTRIFEKLEASRDTVRARYERQ
jgi:hypothetical protein